MGEIPFRIKGGGKVDKLVLLQHHPGAKWPKQQQKSHTVQAKTRLADSNNFQ